MVRSGSIRVGALGVGAALLAACGADAGTDPDASVSDVPRLEVRIVATEPHERTAFTQGLEVDGDRLLEGTGLVGASSVTATDRATGEVLADVDLPGPLFGEGITRAGDILWQLTWQDEIAIARDPVTLEERGRVSYEGEGWGICAYDDRLVTSDGSETLTFRDRETFDSVEVAGRTTVPVTLDGQPVRSLNELECTPDGVYANVWQTDDIVRIDPDSGDVTAVIDASSLREALPSQDGIDVLNGIAAIPDTDRFLLTGKLWPTLFEVEFVPAE